MQMSKEEPYPWPLKINLKLYIVFWCKYEKNDSAYFTAYPSVSTIDNDIVHIHRNVQIHLSYYKTLNYMFEELMVR